MAGTWKYEVETDFSQSANNAFGGSSIAEVFIKNYAMEGLGEDTDDEAVSADRVVINMKTIQNEMKFDITEFVVPAGKEVELVRTMWILCSTIGDRSTGYQRKGGCRCRQIGRRSQWSNSKLCTQNVGSIICDRIGKSGSNSYASF
ncbi:hypothetical protein NYZ99_11465 [Maribacter litopenaei]|uniref:Uncharacterized protein n=1 Tax=Maribacter litopenaei TaxID=2976127 RepID=A0ABY5Y5K2_9FLAO|nr:hypothetical protein [Maribacter litopenaei]UWX53760.1 hypothetical protein NYZ99_11465 [Maribacter litopenaei]